MNKLTRVYQYVQACPNGLRHIWRDKGTGTYIAGFSTKESAMAYRDLHRSDGNKWVTPKDRIDQQKRK